MVGYLVITPSQTKKSYLLIGYLKYEGTKPLSWLTYENGQIIEKMPTIQHVEQPKTYTKLQIRRAMRKMEIENMLDSIISGNTEFSKDWNDAQEISLTDQSFMSALTEFQINDDIIDSIIDNIQE